MTDTIKPTHKTIMIRFDHDMNGVKLGTLIDALSEFSRDAEVVYSDSYSREQPVNSVVFDEANNKVIIDKVMF